MEEEKGKAKKSGFFGAEKRGIQKGVLGGIIMIVIAVVWFVVGWAAGFIFYYPPILLVIGIYAVIKGLFTQNLAGKKPVEIDSDEGASDTNTDNVEEILYSGDKKSE